MRSRFVALAIVAALALTGCSQAGPASSTAPVKGPTPAPTVKQCVYTASGQAARPVDPPSGVDVPRLGTIKFTMNLTAGPVNMTFNRAGAPCAVHSFEWLVSQGFFDNTDCPRLQVGFVLQCGDPTGTTTGGPGYSFADELSGTEKYTRGTVAMANAGADTNGSQFFIVLADADLSPNYDVLGTVDDASMAVVDAIAAKGVDPSDPGGIKPLWGAHIDTITAG